MKEEFVFQMICIVKHLRNSKLLYTDNISFYYIQLTTHVKT